MSTAPPPVVLTEEGIRQAINRWSAQSSFRIRYFGDKIFIDRISPNASYTIALRTQYEERAVSRATVPYAGGLVDGVGVPPGPWELPVRYPTDFEDRTETIPIPHTESVGTCTQCTGVGSIGCPTCQGTGRVTCSRCQGRGYVSRQEARQVTDGSGQVRQQFFTVDDACACINGLVSCGTCAANGRITCPGCAGSGQTKSYDQVTVRFHTTGKREVVDVTDVPDELVGAAKGETVVDLRETALVAPEIVPPVDQRIDAQIREARAIDPATTHILFQHLLVERIQVHEVAYRYAGEEKRLWVYGTEELVHAPGAPWLWKRAAAIVAAAVGGIIGLIALVVSLAR